MRGLGWLRMKVLARREQGGGGKREERAGKVQKGVVCLVLVVLRRWVSIDM